MRTNTSILIHLTTLACALLCATRVPAVETPRRADEFVDTIGINAHIDGQTYSESIIGQSGIRHIRSNIRPGAMPLTYARLSALYAKYGIRVNVGCDMTDVSPAQYRDMMRDPIFASIEGLNEPDVVGPRSYAGLTDNWATGNYAATMKFQQDLFSAMAADATTAMKPVLSPAMANPANSRFLQGAPADYIAMHSYPSQEMPTGNFLVSFAIPAAHAMATPGTSMRLVATETGYLSGSGSLDISHTATTKYVPRLYAEYFRLGVLRTYIFELLDAPGVYNWGLLEANWNAKPAFNALKNMISLLKEASWDASQQKWNAPTFSPAMLDYKINGATANTHHVLLQKSNGKMYLLLWQEVPSYDLTSRRDISNPVVPVDVTFNYPLTSGALYQLDSTSPKATYSNAATVRVNVPDEVVVLEFTPGVPPPEPVATVHPVLSVAATSPRALATLNQFGQFTVSRAGPTNSALTIPYSVSGTAVGGVDYEPLSGWVSIPAGATEASITVVPRSTTSLGKKTLALTLGAGGWYELGNAKTATVYIGDTRKVVADFESGASGWSSNVGTSTSWSTTDADSGIGALKVVMNVNGAYRWRNDFKLSFSSPQDWRAVSRIELRLKESTWNPASDVGKGIYFTWGNNGAGANGGYAVGKILLSKDLNYRTVVLELGDFPRDRVTDLAFYIDGSTFEYGSHTLYIDNIVAVSGTSAVLADFEQSGISAWTSGSQSALQPEYLHTDGGTQALKWTYNDSPGMRWDNHIVLNFSQPIDLGQYSTLSFRFKESTSNPTSDIWHRVYLDFYNNGVRANNGAAVDSFVIHPANGGYRTVELNLGAFRRDKVNSIFFVIDGDAFTTGQHVWYIDNMTVH